MLAGAVVEAGQPVATAELRLIDAESRVVVDEGITGADGEFQFEVAPGRYDLGVFKADYATMWQRGLQASQDRLDLRIELTPAAFVDGASTSSGDCD